MMPFSILGPAGIPIHPLNFPSLHHSHSPTFKLFCNKHSFDEKVFWWVPQEIKGKFRVGEEVLTLVCCCMSGCAVTAAVTVSPAIKSRKKDLVWDFEERKSWKYNLLGNKEADMKTISTETTQKRMRRHLIKPPEQLAPSWCYRF